MSEESDVCRFLSFLLSLPDNDRNQLISKPSCAYFVFRMLPPIAQQIVVQLIWKRNVPTAENIDASQVQRYITLLTGLGLVLADRQSNVTVIDDSFQRAYLYSVMSGSSRISNLKIQLQEERKKPKDINKVANERWECILKYLALPSEQNRKQVSGDTKELLVAAQFTKGEGERIEITTSGFQFLLLSPVEQMWTYIIEYLKLEITRKHDVVELIELLIQVILCATKGYQPGQETFLLDQNWSKPQMDLISQLRELGVIFIKKTKYGVFYLTPLLAHLATNELAVDNSTEKTSNGTIIVETNFRLYAYTSSQLQLAILSTFTDMTYRFNDMSVGMLTRESVRRALQVGITAAQIISFLRTNAHQQCLAASGPVNCLPITVADQIRLWEDERKRMDLKDAYMYSAFESDQEYFGVRNFAQDQGLLLWADNNQKLVIVTEDGHERVKLWYKENRQTRE